MCVDVSKSNEVSMFVRVSAVDVFNDQEDDGAIDESTNLDDTAELLKSSDVTIVVSVAIITFVEVTFGGSDEEVNGSDEVVSGSDEEVSDVCGNNKEVRCCSEEVNDSDEETCGSVEDVNDSDEDTCGSVEEVNG